MKKPSEVYVCNNCGKDMEEVKKPYSYGVETDVWICKKCPFEVLSRKQERMLNGKLVVALTARVKKLEAQLQSMPNIMYLELLETTAWMGIPEKKREDCISAQVDNIKFIVNRALEGNDETK